MNTIKNALALFILISCFSTLAMAETVTFTDTSKHWLDFGTPTENNKDVIGTPDLYGGSFEIDENSLSNISLNYYSNTLYGQAPGDWFIDYDHNGIWDYVITTASAYRGSNTNTAFVDINSNTAWKAYSVAIGYGDLNNYIRSYALNTGSWDIRDCHPALAKSSFLSAGNIVSAVTFSGFFAGTHTASWQFANALDLGDAGKFIYGFAMTCANDVLYGTAEYTVDPDPGPGPNPVPEPGTALLVGIGLLGLAATGRRRRA